MMAAPRGRGAAMGLETGQVIRGKYRVVRLLGDGGMGSVYEATHEALRTRVALKLIHPELARAGLGQRFLQEARAAARIRSRHVVQVADVDQTEDGRPFMVLEYIEGLTLQELYDDLTGEGRALGYADALEYAMQMFDGVEAAHEAGVVHRDLKPDNVMITKDARGAPLIKILDFGIAKVIDSDDARKALTRPGVVLGTPEYMAPEQAYSAATADARADVFSLGVIIFEMFSGRRPAAGDEPQQIALAYLTGEIARLGDLCPALAPEIVAAVHRAMAPLPADRFPHVREMREAIEPFALAVRPPRPSRPGPTGTGITAIPAPSGGSAPRPWPRPESSSAPHLVAGGPPAGAPPPAALPGTWIRGEPVSADAAGASPPRAPTEPMPPPADVPPAPHPPTVSDVGLDATVQAPPDPARAVAAWPGPPVDAPPPDPSGPRSLPSWPYGPQPAPAPLAPPARRRRMLLPLVILGVVLVGGTVGVGIGVWYYYFDDDDTPSRPVQHRPPRPRPGPTQRPPHQLR
jgi:serine/threonine protein kinase